MISVDIDLIGVPAFVVSVEPGTGILRFAGVNAKFVEVTGLSVETMVERTAAECMASDVADVVEANYRLCAGTHMLREYDEFFDRPDGRHWWRTALTPEIDPETGEVVRILGVAVEITEHKRLEIKLEDAVYVDHLTGVANRRRLELDVEDALAEMVYSHRPFSLVVVDLDGFKAINDEFGHRVGDDVLRHVASLISMATRKTDTVARIGGDEFAIKMSATTEVELAGVITSLRRFLDRRLDVSGISLNVGLSIGGALWQPGQTFEDLLAVVDANMYLEKASRRAA